jgi:hypothetical protein
MQKLSVPVGDKGRVGIFDLDTAGDGRGNVHELIPQSDDFLRNKVLGLCPKDVIAGRDKLVETTLCRIKLYARAMGRILVCHWLSWSLCSLVFFVFLTTHF